MKIARPLAALLAATALALTGCAGDDLSSDNASDDSGSSGSADKGSLTIAGQNFPEATLVASMYEQLLEDAGYTVETKLVDSRDAYMPTFPGDVDIVPEYVGGIVNFLNTQADAEAEPFEAGDGQQLADDGASLLEDAGIELLDISPATDTNAFFVTQDYADAEGVTTLSDLEGKSVVLAAAPDCEGRLDCEGGLSDDYGVDVTKVLELGYASAQTYKSVIDGESQLGETSTTDGTLESQGLVVLEDDKEIQPAQNLVPAVSADFLAEHPDVADILNPLMAALTTENLTEMNGQMAVDRAKPEDVAKEFLTSEGLL
ncbi:ABC transporter substrate-binding protein [Nocardioides sp.]|uniref:ABC transporter substrate-binding protein n=1 Tax=Nocardioides sp. TaxID=35761 RepID=UPI002630DE9A|nr:ABC transporter substrate-binding protein [Nocardioides sp.]MCW2735828.1 Substrate-binding region of ABC-type glycine betaine transport system [Nocardioides sp.]